MSQQIQITGGAKVRDLQDVIIGTSGVLSSVAFDVANGVPKLDVNGKILVSQLPNSVMEYKGTWNAATNTPTLANGTGNQGDVYLCEVAGTVNFGAGPIQFFVGDSVIYSGSIWQRASGATGTVTSVGLTETGDALTITGSPITTSGTLNIAFAGNSSQYVNGAGNLTTFPILTGFVPYTGATANVDLGTFGLLADYLKLNVTPTSIPTTESTMAWNDTDGTMDIKLKGGNVTLQVGQEQVVRVVNKSGASLLEADYKVVRIRSVAEGGAQGQRLAVVLAQGDTSAHSKGVLGLVTETIADNQEGFITILGQVHEIDTTGTLQSEIWVDGDKLYLSATTAGKLTNVAPVAPNHSVVMGYVEYAHAVHGKIFVNVNEGISLDELHDVYAPSPSANQSIWWNASTLRYENNTIAGILGYTPANDALVVHLAGTETITGSKTFTGAATFSNTLGNSIILNYGAALVKGNTPSSTSGVWSNIYAAAGNNNLVIADNANISKLQFQAASTYTYTFPALTGTLALTSDISYPVTSVFGRTGAVVATSGDYTTTQVTEGTNLYFTDARARAAITLTTTGTSGAATYVGGVLNIPQYQSALTNPVTGTGTTNYLPKFTGASTIGNSVIQEASGSIGINVSPVANLQVGSTSDVVIAMSNSSSVTSGNRGGIAWYNSSVSTVANIRAVAVTDNVGTQLEFYTRPAAGSLTQVMTLSSTGNLGLGVTPSAWYSTVKAFQFSTTGSLWAVNGQQNTLLSTNDYIDSAATARYIANGYAMRYQQIDGAHSWQTAPSGTAGNAISFTQAMTLTSDGNLLLGTPTNAGFRLAINGPDGTSYVKFTSPSATTGGRIGYNGNELRIDQQENADLVLRTNGSTRLTIASTGAATFSSSVTAVSGVINGTTDAFFDINRSASGNAGRVRFQTAGTDEFEIGLKGGVAGFHITKGDATELVTILTSGNVGIGTVSPDRLFTIAPASGDAYINLKRPVAASTQATLEFNTAGTSDWLIRTDDASANLKFYSYGTSGYPLILAKTTGAATFSGQIISTVASDILAATSSGTAYKWINIANTGGNLVVGLNNSVGGATISTSAYASYIFTRTATDLVFGTNEAVRMTLTSGGNVGIGGTPTAYSMTSPFVEIKNSANNSAILLSTKGTTQLGAFNGNVIAGAGTTANLGLFSDGGYVAFGSYINGYTSYTETMRITSGGNILIGTTDDGSGSKVLSYSTSAATQFKAAGTAPAITFTNTITGASYGGVLGACTSANQFISGTSAGDMVLANQFSGYRLYAVSYSGGVYLTSGATSWTANSDIRLKNINGYIENAVEKLSTLQAINFSYKDDKTNKQNLGLIAQEVEKIFPELIDKNGDGMLGVRYTELVPVLIKAVQELKAEINNLKNK